MDLAKAKTTYRTVEKETADYIVGSVGLTNYPASDDVHVFVHKDGWIAAYYGKDEPASKIMDWVSYSPGKANTKVYLGLVRMAGTVGAGLTAVKYADTIYQTMLAGSQAELEAKAKAVSPRIAVEYADTVYQTVLAGTGELSGVANIPPRIKVEYADTIFSVNYRLQAGSIAIPMAHNHASRITFHNVPYRKNQNPRIRAWI